MPGLSPQTLIFAFALLLVLLGLVGLAPSLLPLLRRQRLAERLSNLKVSQPAAALESEALGAWPAPPAPLVVADAPRASVPEAPGAHVPEAPQPPPPAVPHPSLLPPMAADSADDDGADADFDAGDEPEIQNLSSNETEDSAVETEADRDEGEQEVAADEEDEEVDEMMALFREAKVVATTPAVLAEAYETVSAVDLLAQIRELRDMLRSGS